MAIDNPKVSSPISSTVQMMIMTVRMFLRPSHTLKPLNYIAAAAAMSSCSGGKAVLEEKKKWIHQVSCKVNPQEQDPKDFYIRTLTAVLGSEEAAKKAFLVVNGTRVYRGFSALNLTPEQAHQLSKQPGVSRVYKNDRTIDLGEWRRLY